MKKPERAGSYLIADDALIAIVGGKFTLQGVYTGDIVIPMEGIQIGQLIFFMNAVTPIERPFKKLGARIIFPGQDEPFTLFIPDPRLNQKPPSHKADRTVQSARFPFPVTNVPLFRGKIQVFLTHEDGEIELSSTWIVTAEEEQQAAALVKTR